MMFVWTLFVFSGFSLIWAISKHDADQFLVEVGRSYNRMLDMLPLKNLFMVIHGTGKRISYRDVAEMIPRSCDGPWNEHTEMAQLKRKACQFMDQFAQQYLTALPLQGWSERVPNKGIYISGHHIPVPHCDAKAILPKYCQSHAAEAVRPKCFKLEQAAATFLSTYSRYDVIPGEKSHGDHGGPTYGTVEWMVPIVCDYNTEHPFWEFLSPSERSHAAALCGWFYLDVVELLKAMTALPTEASDNEVYPWMMSFEINNPKVTFKRAMPYIRPACAKIEMGFYNEVIREKIGEVRELCQRIDQYA